MHLWILKFYVGYFRYLIDIFMLISATPYHSSWIIFFIFLPPKETRAMVFNLMLIFMSIWLKTYQHLLGVSEVPMKLPMFYVYLFLTEYCWWVNYQYFSNIFSISSVLNTIQSTVILNNLSWNFEVCLKPFTASSVSLCLTSIFRHKNFSKLS